MMVWWLTVYTEGVSCASEEAYVSVLINPAVYTDCVFVTIYLRYIPVNMTEAYFMLEVFSCLMHVTTVI